MSDIVNLKLIEYLNEFRSLRTPLSDFFVKTRKCTLTGLKGEDGLAKVLLITEVKHNTEILFLSSVNDDVALKQILLDHLIESLTSQTAIIWRIPDTDSNKEIAINNRFICTKTVNLYRSVGSGDERLIKILSDNDKIYNYMFRFGYQVKTFNELSEDELYQINSNPDNEFVNGLHPESFTSDITGGFKNNFSFAATKNGKVAAYNIVRCPDGRHCVFEIICVGKSYSKKGVFILPFLSSLRAMNEAGIEGASFAIYETNRASLNVINKRFSQLITSHTIQHNYIYASGL